MGFINPRAAGEAGDAERCNLQNPEATHPVVEDAAAAAHQLQQAQVVLTHHGVPRHHDVNALPQQLINHLPQRDGSASLRTVCRACNLRGSSARRPMQWPEQS